MTIVDYAIGGNNTMLRRLVNESNVNTVGPYNKGVLHWAVIRGNIEMMNLWLSFPNCNVNIQSKFGNTPLHECVTVREWQNNFSYPFGNIDIELRLKMITLLFKAGADVTIRNNTGDTPLSMLTDKDCVISHHIRNIMWEPFNRIETFFCCAQYVIDEMDIDAYMENEGYEYEDTETFFFRELVKNVNEEAILHDIFKYL